MQFRAKSTTPGVQAYQSVELWVCLKMTKLHWKDERRCLDLMLNCHTSRDTKEARSECYKNLARCAKEVLDGGSDQIMPAYGVETDMSL